jgi:type II secretory pathway pseudopilin PulG
MKKRLKKPTGIFGMNGNRGSVLIELMVAAIIFAVVVAAIAFYFIYHVGTMNSGRAQLKLQRVGSLLMEEMARAIREGKTTDLPEDNDFHPSIMITYPHTGTPYPDTGTQCFTFENNDIKGGSDCNNQSFLEILDDSHTVGGETRTHRILCDTAKEELSGLFKKEGDRVTIQFKLIHDMETEDTGDDLDIEFGSTVKLRG